MGASFFDTGIGTDLIADMGHTQEYRHHDGGEHFQKVGVETGEDDDLIDDVVDDSAQHHAAQLGGPVRPAR